MNPRKELGIRVAGATRECLACNRPIIKKGEKFLEFVYMEGTTYQVTANICKECVEEFNDGLQDVEVGNYENNRQKEY